MGQVRELVEAPELLALEYALLEAALAGPQSSQKALGNSGSWSLQFPGSCSLDFPGKGTS